MPNKRVRDLKPGDRIEVDRVQNPNDPQDYASFYEEVVMVEPIGPAERVYTNNHTFTYPEDLEVPLEDE